MLDRLGLAPSDPEVVRRAFESSALRQRSAILPLCAAALGARLEAAQELSTESCRQVVLGTADARSESPARAARNVALTHPNQLGFRSATHSYSTPENAGFPARGARGAD